MNCPACNSELHMDGSCPKCKAYADKPEPNYMRFEELNDKERELLRRVEDTK